MCPGSPGMCSPLLQQAINGIFNHVCWVGNHRTLTSPVPSLKQKNLGGAVPPWMSCWRCGLAGALLQESSLWKAERERWPKTSSLQRLHASALPRSRAFHVMNHACPSADSSQGLTSEVEQTSLAPSCGLKSPDYCAMTWLAKLPCCLDPPSLFFCSP